MKNRYPDDTWQEILGNCDIRLCLGVTDTLTAQYFCDLIGVATVETQSIKKEEGIEGDLEYGQKNISTTKRNLLNADEILRLPHTQLLVNIRGNKPLILDKMIYTEHTLSKKLKDFPISMYNPTWNKKAKVIDKEYNETNEEKENEIDKIDKKEKENTRKEKIKNKMETKKDNNESEFEEISIEKINLDETFE